nr:hypothetical protein [Priestia megaterium]MDH3188976.1 hypothetical protein [Priestia megaterium]MDH3188987.1 hypothetical protein [Priestia megaterium]
MKKRLKIWVIFIIIVIFLAIGIPRIVGNETNSLNSEKEKKEVVQLEKDFRQWSLRPIDRFMVQSYKVKSNGHQWDTEGQKSIKNYRLTYYTFFGIRYMQVEIS